MVERCVRVRREDVVLLGGILCGDDNLVAIHGEQRGSGDHVIVRLVTTDSRLHELDEWLALLAETIELAPAP